MTTKKFADLITLAAAAGLVAAPIAASAQPVAGPADPLGLPTSPTAPSQPSPNVRTATAVVNGHVITGTDVDQRVALLLAANEQQISGDEIERLRMQVLRNLIDETLQIQAAEAQEMPVPVEDVNRTYQQVAARNFGQDPAAADAYLASIGSSPASLKRQIKGEIAWRRLLSRNVAPFVNVSEEEVNENLKRIEEDRGTEEFRLGEIFIASTPETAAQAESNAVNIVEQLRRGGSFAAYARQYSQASTAAVGGDLGWVRLPQLPSDLASAASQMQPGQLVGPLPVPGGFSILLLIDKRQVAMADPRDAVLSLKQISIEFSPDEPEAEKRAQLERFTQGVDSMRGCGDVEDVAARIGAEVVTNNEVRVRSLPEQVQAMMLALQVGQATPPFGGADEGARVLMLCGRDDPEVESGPNFQQLMTQLEDERIGKRAQRYLRDLRNDAYIEYN